jgi:murein DD-endopeptidase MepM/ murein hydrolase activator NlpD
VLFVDPHTHKQVKVLPSDVVGELLKAKGVKVRSQHDHTKDREKAEAERRAQMEFEVAWRARAAAAINSGIQAGMVTAFGAPLLRRLCLQLFHFHTNGNDISGLLPLWGLPVKGGDDWSTCHENVAALERHIGAAPDTDLGRMVLTMMFADELDGPSYSRYEGEPSNLELLARETCVDVASIQREVKAERKAAAKVAKAPRATSPAAQAEEVAEGAPATEAAGAKKPRGKAAKLSADAAKQGIADAMQSSSASGENDFEVGQRVRFKVALKSTAGRMRKIAGREGTILSKQGDRAWSVTHQGTAGEEVFFADYTELEHVDAAGGGEPSTEGATP